MAASVSTFMEYWSNCQLNFYLLGNVLHTILFGCANVCVGVETMFANTSLHTLEYLRLVFVSVWGLAVACIHTFCGNCKPLVLASLAECLDGLTEEKSLLKGTGLCQPRGGWKKKKNSVVVHMVSLFAVNFLFFLLKTKVLVLTTHFAQSLEKGASLPSLPSHRLLAVSLGSSFC